MHEVESYRGDTDRALTDLRAHVAVGGVAVLVVAGPGTAQRAIEQLRDADVPAKLVEQLSAAPEPGLVTVTCGCLTEGLTTGGGLVLLTEADVTGNRAATTDSRTLGSKRRRNAVDLVTLQPGDYVVHAQHGIGRFVEMRERTVSGATREYLVLEYASSKRGQPPDRLFVPTDALDEISRYVGGEVPTLNKLGGADWAKTKGRARRAVREIAAQLVQLYAARQSAPGHAFAPDTPWQRELEDAFPFTETPDQLSAIDEVKADMERPVPMDRVVSGDVGFGKTEIAVRAAFKAVQDGKQVAVLVPTTLLATQHLQTFSDRMRAFPVNVKGLSRFTDNAEAKQTIAGLADGTVDVVVGTHRLLQTGVRWKDLGLVIVDEEQRFGVEHKEHITAMRTHVDVLTLSATPIPRTLEMSLAGIREMSTITTPPEDRHPTLTYVGAYADKQVAAAIRRELLRDGQVFYVHNRVSTIERAARHVRELVPEARVAVAHGQMNEDTARAHGQRVLAQRVRRPGLHHDRRERPRHLEREHADRRAQRHAGPLAAAPAARAGRARSRARLRLLPLPARAPAHRDRARPARDDRPALRPRLRCGRRDEGPGDPRRGQHPGCRAERAHRRRRVRPLHPAGRRGRRRLPACCRRAGERRGRALAEVRVDLPVDAHVPHDYVPGERLRLEAYRKIAEAADQEALDAIVEELTDRYGEPPAAVHNLLAVAAFRQRCRAQGVAEVALAGANVRISPVELPDSAQLRLRRLHPKAQYKAAAKLVTVPRPVEGGRIGGSPLRDVALLDWCAALIGDVLVPVAAVR